MTPAGLAGRPGVPATPIERLALFGAFGETQDTLRELPLFPLVGFPGIRRWSVEWVALGVAVFRVQADLGAAGPTPGKYQ